VAGGERPALLLPDFPPFIPLGERRIFETSGGAVRDRMRVTMGGILQWLERTGEGLEPTDRPALENSAGCGGGLSTPRHEEIERDIRDLRRIRRICGARARIVFRAGTSTAYTQLEPTQN